MNEQQTTERIKSPLDEELEEIFSPMEFQAPTVQAAPPIDRSLFAVAKDLGPRNETEIEKRALRVGARMARAEGMSAVEYDIPFKSKNGTQHVKGPTVGLMEALADVWGCIAMQTWEDPALATPTMTVIMAQAVDLKTARLVQRPFRAVLSPAPGGFRGESAERWNTMQRQAAVSKAQRGVLEHFIPGWVVAAAFKGARDELASSALRDSRGNTISLEAAVANWCDALQRGFGISEAQLIAWMACPKTTWTTEEVGRLAGLYRDLKAQRVTVAEVVGEPAAEVVEGDGLPGK